MKIISHFVLFVAAVLSLLAANATSAEKEPVRYSLFNGTDLAGWHVLGCKAGVENGALVIQEGNGVVRTNHRYGDFVFEVKYRARNKEKYDSGIYFRCELPPEGKPWPQRYQVNLKQNDECNLIGFAQGRTKPELLKASEWNAVKLKVVGDRAELEVNDQPAWAITGIEARTGYILLQCEVPGGGQYEFKDIFVTELDHHALFNGQSLDGWEGGGENASCWKADAGELVCTGEKGPWLRCQKTVGDFNLRLEYKLKEGGNSGVFVRVNEKGEHHGPGNGAEVQILDDASPRYKSLAPGQFSASVYQIAPASPRVSKPAGDWNSLEINGRGPNYRVVHNGVQVVDAAAEKFPELAKLRLEGFLGLQNHNEEVRFRNLRLGPAME